MVLGLYHIRLCGKRRISLSLAEGKEVLHRLQTVVVAA
jgi:hypothetical protein